MMNQTSTTKKVLVVDDSALMRSLFCAIINSDKRFEVVDIAVNGVEALEFLQKKSYDAVVMDISMPMMDGLQLLRELRKRKIAARVMVVSSHTYEGAKITMDALTLGALDFLQKPGPKTDKALFRERFLEILEVVASGAYPDFNSLQDAEQAQKAGGEQSVRESLGSGSGSKIVAIASSTGGPRALQSVIPYLPEKLDAPVLLVQHMPKGFTASLAERLNELSKVSVKEAVEGEELKKGTVYVAMGGQHMTVSCSGSGRHVIHYTDEPPREGVKPSANYMYESLADSKFDHIICAVMTGMGADGTAGIRSLRKAKDTYVIAQNKETCTVYGMPKSVVAAGLTDTEIPLEQIAQKIAQCTGTRFF